MAANTNPISPIAPATSWPTAPLLTGNTALDGTGTIGSTVATVYTAGANGGKVNRIRVVHLGTNVATVLRIFLNNGATNTVAANNQLVTEATMAANTLSQVAASVFVDIPVNITLKPGYKINYTIGTTVAAGHAVTADAGDY